MIPRLLFCCLLIVFSHGLKAQSCDDASLIKYDVRASETDPDINWELLKHQTYFNPDCEPRNLLLVHLVGSLDNPGSTTFFPSVAANCGFHVLVLKYPNQTAAQTACAESEDINCYGNFRKEIIEGVDVSDELEVDFANSILNRTLKLILHLKQAFPEYNWHQYLDSNENLIWDQILFSGHSQGGGHAAYIAKQNKIHRALMFASPNDYSNKFNSPAPWLKTDPQTEITDYYGFNNVKDNIVEFEDQYEIWQDLNLYISGDTVNIENTPYPYNETRQLIISRDTSGLVGNHSMMIIDDYLPTDETGRAKYIHVWKYMLGVDIVLSSDKIDSNQYGLIYPNPVDNIFKLSNLNHQKGSLELSIFNIHSELVSKVHLTEHGNDIEMDVSSLVEGIYLLHIYSDNKLLKSMRFVKL